MVILAIARVLSQTFSRLSLTDANSEACFAVFSITNKCICCYVNVMGVSLGVYILVEGKQPVNDRNKKYNVC